MEILIAIGAIALVGWLASRGKPKTVKVPGEPEGPAQGEGTQKTICSVCGRTIEHQAGTMLPAHPPCTWPNQNQPPKVDPLVPHHNPGETEEEKAFIDANKLELDAINAIEAMIGEDKTIIFDGTPIRADGNGIGSVTNPTDVPVQGQYYQTRENDNPSHIMSKAGLQNTKWRQLARLNEWCEKRDSSGTLVGLKLYKRWSPPGFNTTFHATHLPGDVFPVIYIPKISELTQ